MDWRNFIPYRLCHGLELELHESMGTDIIWLLSSGVMISHGDTNVPVQVTDQLKNFSHFIPCAPLVFASAGKNKTVKP